MNERPTTPESGSTTEPRSERRVAALVAEYIHELSDRHGGPASTDITRPSDRFAIRGGVAR
jgi:hypothetical protein